MFELGFVYGLLLIFVYLAPVMDLIFIAVNKFWRKEYFANYVRHGISIFKLIFCAIIAGFAVYVLIEHHARLSLSMFMIHLVLALLLVIDIALSVFLKIYIEKKSKAIVSKKKD
ncbi:MAG: hypothetical protein LBM41_03970 [Ruminococcus sp.]|jgi:hypothetical protein|nr:hypothetical protein [Ruminococcus sp.]